MPDSFVADSFVEDEEQDSFIEDSFIEDAPTRKPNKFMKVVNTVFNPLANERQYLGNKIAQDVQIGKDVVGATGMGQLARVATAPPIRTIMDYATGPEVVGSTVREGLNPWNWLVGKGAQKTYAAAETGLPKVGQTLARTPKLMTAASPKNAPTIAGRIRDVFARTKGTAGDRFGGQLDDLATKFPERHVSLRSTVDKLNEIRTQSPKLSSDLLAGARKSGNTLLKDLLDNPELADDLTIVQAQEVKKALQKIPSIASKQGKFGAQFTDTDLDVLDAINDVRSSMLESFPEMEKVFGDYAATITKFKTLKNKFKVGSLVKNIEQDFSDPEVLKMVQELLPPEAMNDIRLLRRSMKARGLAKTGAIGAASTVGAGAILKTILGQRQ